MASNGLTGKLARTKTTGGGKKVREMIVFVPSEAWIVEPRWLQVGFDLWVALAPWDRDHFSPDPSPTWLASKSAMREFPTLLR